MAAIKTFRELRQKPKVPEFVRRMNQADAPFLQNQDGTISTHRMAWGSDDDGFYAFPTIVNRNGKLEKLSPEDADNYAHQTGELKRFDTQAEVEAYAAGSWKVQSFEELRSAPSFEQLRTQPDFEERQLDAAVAEEAKNYPDWYKAAGKLPGPQFPSNAPRDIRTAPTLEKRPSEFRAMPELTGWQKTKRFFTGDRPPLPPNADRMEKLDRVFDRAIGTPLRVFLKFAKGKVFGADELMWAGIKKITPDSMWDAEVKKMTLDQAMDRAAGYDPSGFEKIVGDLAEFVGRLQTAGQIGRATGILGKAPKDATKLMRAGEAAKLFGLAATGEQFSKLLSETIDPQTDYQYEGAIGVLKDMGIGAGLSLGHSAILKPGLAKIAQTAAGKKIIEAADRAVIELTKKFPGLMDTVRRDPRKYFTKEALRWHKQAGGKPFNQWSKKEKVIFKHIVREGERRFTRAYRNYTPPDIVTRAPRRRGLRITGVPGVKQPISAPAVRPVARPGAKVAPTRPTVPQKAAEAVTEGKVVPKQEVAQIIKGHKVEILPRKDEILAELDAAIKKAPLKKNVKDFDEKLRFNIDGGINIYNNKESLTFVRDRIKALPKTEIIPARGKKVTLRAIKYRTADQIFESLKANIAAKKTKSSLSADVRALHGAIPIEEYQAIERALEEDIREELLDTIEVYQKINKERAAKKVEAKPPAAVTEGKILDSIVKKANGRAFKPITPTQAEQVVKAGLATKKAGKLNLTKEGRTKLDEFRTTAEEVRLEEGKALDEGQEDLIQRIEKGETVTQSEIDKFNLTGKIVERAILKKAPPAVTEGKAETKDEYRARIREKAEKPITQEVIVSKPVEVPKAPKVPVTEQKPTVELKGKEAQVFNEAVRTQEEITAAEAGEVGIEPAGASFTDHIETFNSYQLPATSKIPGIVHEMKVINGKRLAGTLTPQKANSRIYNLRKDLMQAAIKEKIAIRVSKKGKVKIALRESGVYVPEDFARYTKFKDIKPILGGGQDIKRAIQQMDGSLTLKEKEPMKGQMGPLEQYVKVRTNKIWIKKLRWVKEKEIEAKNILSGHTGKAADRKITTVLEQIGKADRDAPIKDVLSKETLASMGKEAIKTAQELRQFYDDMHLEQNASRAMLGRDLIPYLENYSPHILADTTVWSETFMRDKTAKQIEKADLPDYIKPNATFNPRAMAREAGIPYDKRILSAKELLQSYIRTAADDIFNTSIIQNNKAFIDQLRAQGYEKSADYLSEWNATAYAGIKPALERSAKLPKWAEKSMKYFNAIRDISVFPLNVAWSLGTQVKSIGRTIGKYGSPNTVRGFYRWMKPETRKRAAQDYYSYIIKSQKRGRVTKQDASNLLDVNISLKRNVGEVVEDWSTIFITEIEKILTGTSIEAAYLHGKKRGLKGEALIEYASDGGAKTQEMYNLEDKPMMLNSLHAKTFTPYQTFALGFVNNLREFAGKTGTPPDTKLYAIWSLIRYLAAMSVINMLTNRIRGKKWSWWDMVPLPFREIWLSPIVAAITKKWLPGSSGLTSPVGTGVRIGKGINDVVETGNWRKLRNETIKYGPGVFGIPGGVQWSRMVDAIIAYSNGGVRDRRGRLLFKLDTPEDLARGMFTGVWSTKGGREYLEKKKQGRPSRPTRRGRR